MSKVGFLHVGSDLRLEKKRLGEDVEEGLTDGVPIRLVSVVDPNQYDAERCYQNGEYKDDEVQMHPLLKIPAHLLVVHAHN